MTTKHTLVVLVEDKPGVLSRVASLFRRRGFNIASITVGASEMPCLSRMTIVVGGTMDMVEQVRKQLEKVVDVVKVFNIAEEDMVARELALLKVRANSSNRSEVIQLADIFRANIIDVASDSVTLEVTGDEDKITALFNLLRGFGVREMARTGRVAMARGDIIPLRVKEKSSKAQRQTKGTKKEG